MLERSRPEWEICGEASDGKQAIEAVQRLNPDVVILDVTMPRMSGLEAAPNRQGSRKLPRSDLHDA
jgi:YesN/AraC family two-component response regulator